MTYVLTESYDHATCRVFNCGSGSGTLRIRAAVYWEEQFITNVKLYKLFNCICFLASLHFVFPFQCCITPAT